jgi:hypothetical protein
MARIALTMCSACLLVLSAFPVASWAQQETPQEKARDGLFEITLKGPDPRRKMNVDELVRDRDLDPAALYRVKAGGYLSFDEGEWVDKIEFKVFDQPVTELPEYKKFSALLVDVNRKIWDMKDMLSRYDLMALRMMNMCDRTRFPTLQSIDDNVREQLTVYRQLELLKGLVVNSLNRFTTERSCKDKYSEYRKTLALYAKRLLDLSKDFERLRRKAVALAPEAKSAPERQRYERESLGEDAPTTSQPPAPEEQR